MAPSNPQTYILDNLWNIPGFKLHPLKGADQGRWSIWVNGHWRVTFKFRESHAFVLDDEDYH
ncbi:MAG: type II toxin-antitoxin system RelE/ParE family toxin [Lamprobacter sp.]|uniref:type II toxin-antitoxin system RelE/ParE family toxin n=1 Tax=Lamprobacter sp. TaxID=3100796 RepID=UPI002B25DDD3|nr:type II toxin-antitoxin system RelE/ParE family toxin [Lamprobacter sp.]MEA3642352.1 type II toxin-antitoxin system RelE/ParE family toxin [Lamprobacter sp.]